MTQEQHAKLLQAYRAAIEAGQDGIADMLEDVILGEIGKSEVKVPVMREIKVGGTTNPFGNVTYETGVPPTDAKMTCTGIDHLSKETMV